MSAAKPTLFFVGVGNMGHPMAANLIQAGYTLWVHDLAPEKARDLMAPILGAAKAGQAIQKVMTLETVKDIRELRPLLQKG